MATFTREQLEGKTSKELKRMCVYELEIPGMTKKDKETVISAILAKYGVRKTTSTTTPKVEVKVPLQGISFTGNSTMTNPKASAFHKTTTTIQVSSGASSGAFPVIGRTVMEVGDFLREVLNVDRLSTGLVNGHEVPGNYVLKQGDNLEFLKPAGKKGC